MKSRAEFSPCRRYRYTLWRWWGGLFADGHNSTNYVNFICLNPSTADETNDDPTVRRCINFARAWGYDGLCVTNIFAYRATLVSDMKAQPAPVGVANDQHLARIARNAALVVCAWGQHGQFLGRSEEVLKLIDGPLHYLRMGRTDPWHPLYLPGDLKPIEWSEVNTKEFTR